MPAMTVREAAYDILRAAGMQTFFGNPGSNELPFLQQFPAGFRYVLALQEGAGLAMADGFARASGCPVLVSLHSAAGVGQAMGNLVNASLAGTPLVIMSGQQHRELLTSEGMLTNRDSTNLPRPLVKWSFEAPSAQSVPAVLARAIAYATTAPTGPVYVSVPLSDWHEPADSDNQPYLLGRAVAGRPIASAPALEDLARRLNSARNPVLVLGPDVDAYGGWDAAVALAERAALPVFLGSVEYGRISFPTDHRCYQGTLGFVVDQVRDQLAPYDFVAWIGGALLPYHAWARGAYLRTGTEVVLVTADPDQAARAPLGDAVVGDPAEALHRLVGLVTAGARTMPPAAAGRAATDAGGDLTNARLLDVLARVAPPTAVWVHEAPSLGGWWDTVPITAPGSYFYGAGSGLGYGLPAAVGVALARPERPVFALIGDGSANYSLPGLWTAAQQRLDITYVIMRNGVYQVLADFAGWLDAPDPPGLSLPGIDFVALAQGYGIPALAATDTNSFEAAIRQAATTAGPFLIEARTAATPSSMLT